MKRYIEIEHVEGTKYRIVKQTHRGFGFSLKRWRFEASNGFVLASNLTPEFYPASNLLCVRGGDIDRDTGLVNIPSDKLEGVFFAIKEYNKTYGSKLPCKCNRAIVCKECMKNLRGEVLAF